MFICRYWKKWYLGKKLKFIKLRLEGFRSSYTKAFLKTTFDLTMLCFSSYLYLLRDVFRTLSNILDETFLQKCSMLDLWDCSEYASASATITFRSSRRRCSIKKGVHKNFTKFTGKHLRQSLFFNKVAGLRPATLVKKSLWHRCFPVNFVKFLRTPFLTEHLWCLLLILS